MTNVGGNVISWQATISVVILIESRKRNKTAEVKEPRSKELAILSACKYIGT